MKVIKATITLEIQTSVENCSPVRWDWHELLDLNSHESVSIVDCNTSEAYDVDSEGEPT